MRVLRLHVDAVISVRDGFTGAALPGGGLLWLLDGRPFRPEIKRDGYVVLTGLSAGEHSVTIRGGSFRDESLCVTADGRSCREFAVTMKPTEKYPFGSAVTWLTLHVEKKGAPRAATVCLAPDDPLRVVKIAQDAAEAGATETRVFCRASGGRGLPANYLLEDGKSTETVVLRELDGEVGYFVAPLTHAHKRGRSLYPAQLFTAGAEGLLQAVYPGPVKLRLFAPETGALKELELQAGQNEATFSI